MLRQCNARICRVRRQSPRQERSRDAPARAMGSDSAFAQSVQYVLAFWHASGAPKKLRAYLIGHGGGRGVGGAAVVEPLAAVTAGSDDSGAASGGGKGKAAPEHEARAKRTVEETPAPTMSM